MIIRRRRWWIVAALVIVIGSTGTFIGNRALVRTMSASSHQLFVSSSQSIASTLQLALQHEQDLVTTTGAFFVENPNANSTAFRRWIAATNTFARYPEVVGVAEVVMVTARELPSYEARALKDPSGALGPGGTFEIVPAGMRSYYCFVRVDQANSGTSVTPAAFDFCDTPLGPEFQRERVSGKSLYFPYGAGASQKLVLGTPIYSTGSVPTTREARLADFLGWTGTSVRPSVVLATAIAHHAKTSVSFTYVNGASRATFTDGISPPHSQSLTISLHNGWYVHTSAGISGAAANDRGNALALLLGGLVLTLMLAAFIVVLGTGRSRAMAMVAERTQDLQHLALHDSLTGLPNRVLILDRIGQMLARARRDDSALAVLFLDLDNFKDINDTLGHAAGDELLIKIAARLSNGLRQTDSVGRLGGDEFVILAEATSLELGASMVADRVLAVLEPPFSIAASDVPISVTASVGIAEGLRDKPEDLLRDADIALYEAKGDGKHRAVTFLASMQKVVDDHRALTVDLGEAVQRGQFFLLYQPTISLASGSFTGVEALLRWRHPTRGILVPAEFLPVLESSGLIVEVGRWVIDEACRQGAVWLGRGRDLSVSVNISIKQLERDRFVDDVRSALQASNFEPTLLILEITETSLSQNVGPISIRLKALKELGLRIAVDDFGKWYSSLSYLRQFPIDILKIDRSLVSGDINPVEADALIQTLVHMGNALGLETIGQGVESPEQRRRLIVDSVDTGQGFLFARPIDVEAINQLVDDWENETEIPGE
jgi:diguanylate cyclase (GGDEF)-like protein